MTIVEEALGASTVPRSWEVRPLWAIARERKGNLNTGMKETNLLSLSFGNVIRKDIDATGGLLPVSFEGYQIVNQGDLILRLTDLQNDKRSLRSGLCTEQGIITSAYLCLVPTGIAPRYFAYLMRAYDVAKVLYPLGGGLRQSLTFEDIRMLPILVPPVEEQRRIADFLDDQVARIDESIVLRRSQREINEARYLDQLRRLTHKPDGARWRVGYAFLSGSGTTPKSDRPEYFDGSTPWVVSGDLNDGVIESTEKTVTNEALTDHSALKVYRPGALLVAMYGATVGRTGLLSISACVNQAVCVLQERGPVSARFAQYWFIARRGDILELASGGGQPNISQEVVRNLRISTGDLRWQRERVDEIDRLSAQRSTLEEIEQAGVRLLEERKRAVITAAVTGELDVTTARPIGVGKWVPNVGASVDSAVRDQVPAQAPSIGGIG